MIDKTTIKFIFVGILNTIVGSSIMFLSYNLIGLNYWASTALNYIVGSVFSYFMNKYFTFKNNSKTKKQIILFIINILLCYVIAYSFAKPLINSILVSQDHFVRDNISMVLGMILFTVLNYLGQRYIVFK